MLLWAQPVKVLPQEEVEQESQLLQEQEVVSTLEQQQPPQVLLPIRWPKTIIPNVIK